MITLRPRQIEFVKRSIEALLKHGNTLGVAPTGAGKSIMLSSVIGHFCMVNPNFKVCVVAHRKELTEQNNDKFEKVNHSLSTSIVNAEVKDWSGQVVFAMVPTLSKKNTLKTIPHLDLLVIDETHHVTAKSYIKIIQQAKEINPNVMIYGITATPQRGDKSSLGQIFNNCGDQIFLGELIESNHLVKPITYSVDVAQEKLMALKKKNAGDYSESEVADILDQAVIVDEVIRHWKAKAGDRKTVIFCSTIKHAEHVCVAFRSYGIRTDVVTSELTKEQREFVLNQLTIGEIQVLINVAILTEGWDYPPISCVVLLRQSSFKSTMIQMIGRGLRTIEPSIYPDIIKKDCVVLDFGISTVLHGSLEQDIDLEIKFIKKVKKEAKTKNCKACDREIPVQTKKCQFCGHQHEAEIKEDLSHVGVVQIDMLKKLQILFVRIDSNIFYMATFNCWCCLINLGESLILLGCSKAKEEEPEIIYQGDDTRQAVNLANYFIKRKEKSYSIQNFIKMANFEATKQQMKYIPAQYKNLSQAEASVILSFQFDAKRKLAEMGYITNKTEKMALSYA
jgi:superfamily II DNA or RNA helicase